MTTTVRSDRLGRAAMRHPLIEGMFSLLPYEDPFSPKERAEWLEAMRLNLDVVYGWNDELAERPDRESE